MGRRFNSQQKQALFWLAGGRCENCGIQLPDNWHADHVQPYAEDGQTDVTNGQALCPMCNLKKGSKLMLKQWPSGVVLRRWQEQFIDRYNTVDRPNFLLVATPGAGKTTASLKVAYNLLMSGTIQRVIVVCPTDNLRTQWLHAAAKVEVQLSTMQMNWNKDIALPADYVGLVTTYQQVASKADHLRAYTGRYNTLVILDEIHHCAESEYLALAWGDSIKKAFDPAVRRLLLSGTPFRSDNHPIPFVTYVPDPLNPKVSRSKADYTYGYGDALKDEEVVRHIVFPGWDGKLGWSDWYGEERVASFDTPLNKTDSGHRLRTAINPNGLFMRDMIIAANQKLDYVRLDHTSAGGLIVAQDQSAAKTLAKVLEEVTGEKPVLAISEIGDEASAEIEKFRKGRQKWIVAVRMVSEGVDIKRLRVGVYATNVTTETFFRQVIGRVIRWDGQWSHLDEQTAWFYVPEDPELTRLVNSISEEVVHWVAEKEEKDRQKSNEPRPPSSTQIAMDGYEFRYADGDERHHRTSGETFPMSEMDEAELRFANSPGFEKIPSAQKALLLRNLGIASVGQADSQSTTITDDPQPEHFRKKSLGKAVNTKVGRLVILCQQNKIEIPGRNPHQAIHNAWGRVNKYSHEATNDEMERKLTWLENLISRALKGDKSITSELR